MPGITVTLPGNTTQSDLVAVMKLASEIIKKPANFDLTTKQSTAIALDGMAKGIK